VLNRALMYSYAFQHSVSLYSYLKYRGAEKSLGRPGRKEARKHFRDARGFNNIETRAVIEFFFPARQSAKGNSRHSDGNISLFPSWSGSGLISTPVHAPEKNYRVRNKIHLFNMPEKILLKLASRCWTFQIIDT